MSVGFSVVSQRQDIELRLFRPPHDGRPPLVTFFQAIDGAAVLMGRLYYRQEVLTALASQVSADWRYACDTNDAALALAVYRHCGLRGVERLEGSFALVLWDATAHRLVGARDPLGGYPLFWAACGGTIALSTSLRPLLNLLPHRTLSLEYLAALLTVPLPVNELASERCAYEGIARILPGTTVSLHVPSGDVERSTYWHWLDRLLDPGTDRLEELSEQYGHLLRRAVRERLCGRTASHVSGGMDSTAVALIADDWIRAGAGEAPLHTLSLVYHQLPGLARETVYLDSVPARSGIVPHRIPADNLLDFDSFADPPLHDEPYAMLWRLGMDRALVETAAACGAATMLTGIGADELLDVQPFYLTDLLRSGHFRTAWTEACKWARCDNCSPWAMLYPFGIGPLLPAWMRGGPVRALLRSGHTTSISNQHNWHIPPWITRSFAHRYALREQTLSATHPHDRTGQPVGVSFALASIASRTGEVGSWAVAAPQGIAVAHPFLDARVVCLGLGMQRRLRPEPGRLKPVLAEAMRDVLPAKIRDRRRKGQFNEVYYLGLARNLQPLEAMIRHAPIDDLGVFDKEVLVRCLHEAALGGAQVGQLHRLNLTLSFIKWLCMQPVWQGSLEPPTEVIRARWHDSLTAAGPSR